MSPGRARGWAAEIGDFIRANLSSTAATGVDWLVVAAVLHLAHYEIAVVLGAVAGAVTDFALKRHWAFDREHKAAVHHEGARYVAVSGGSLLLNMALAYVAIDLLHLPKLPSIIAASIVVGFGWNYPLHRLFVFRNAAPPAPLAARGPVTGGPT